MLQHKPWYVSVLLCHVIQPLAEALEKPLELFQRGVPQLMNNSPVRQDDIWLELVGGIYMKVKQEDGSHAVSASGEKSTALTAVPAVAVVSNVFSSKQQ